MARKYKLLSLVATLSVFLLSGNEAKSSKNSIPPKAPPRQIFEASKHIGHSDDLNADGVAAYVVSSMGTNRGFLVKEMSRGPASDLGIGPGDVVLSFEGHVVQSANDVDSVLGSMPSGMVRVMFVHPGDAGLQLYNAQLRWVNQGGNAVRTSRGGGTRSGRADSGNFANSPDFRPSVETYVVELINQDRSQNGVSTPVHMNAALQSIARAHAMDMIKRNFFAHVNPDGLDPQARARAAGITGGVSENIAMEQSPASDSSKAAKAEATFMSEPPNQQNHRSNILGTKHVAVGVGVAVYGQKLILVQDFADYDP